MGAPSARQRIFCATSPGLELLLCDELRELGLSSRAVPGGAEAEGDDAALLACLASRLSDAVHLRLWEGPTSEIKEARREAARLAGGLPLLIRPRGERSTVSVDATVDPLFRRGWRARIGAAPLRETLAAGLLRAGGFRGDRPFLDPMCGSGTLAIEAALLAARRAPGLDRPLALEALPGHDPGRLERLRRTLRSAERPVEIPIYASDRNGGVLRLAEKNAAAAGVRDQIRFTRCDAAAAPAPEGPGLCAVNPPFGVRLEEGTQKAWQALSTLSKRLFRFDLVVLGPDKGLEKVLTLSPLSSLPVQNGGMKCKIFHYRL